MVSGANAGSITCELSKLGRRSTCLHGIAQVTWTSRRRRIRGILWQTLRNAEVAAKRIALSFFPDFFIDKCKRLNSKAELRVVFPEPMAFGTGGYRFEWRRLTPEYVSGSQDHRVGCLWASANTPRLCWERRSFHGATFCSRPTTWFKCSKLHLRERQGSLSQRLSPW